MIVTKEHQEALVSNYVKEKHNADECLGFIDGLNKALELVKNLTIPVVNNWVAIESTEQPERVTEVMVKYKGGIKEVALFDGDGRYYIEKDDRDITDRVIEWHRLP